MPSTLSYCTELPTICDHCSSRKNGLKSCLQASNFQNISGGHAPRPLIPHTVCRHWPQHLEKACYGHALNIVHCYLNKLYIFTEETARAQWQNEWDQPLSVHCQHNNQAFYQVKSYHDNRREDRRWQWNCRTVLTNTLFSNCHWTSWVNEYDQPLSFQCPANKVLTGVFSVHDNRREDRRWKFQCCGAKGYYTRNCYLTYWINDWDSSMNHVVHSPQVFTGAYSYHDNGRE